MSDDERKTLLMPDRHCKCTHEHRLHPGNIVAKMCSVATCLCVTFHLACCGCHSRVVKPPSGEFLPCCGECGRGPFCDDCCADNRGDTLCPSCTKRLELPAPLEGGRR